MTMVTAPFYGEFGWECMLWAPWLRWNKHNLRKHDDFTVICKPGHEALYQDFATEVVPVQASAMPNITRVDCQNIWIDGVQLRDYASECGRLLQRRVFANDVLHPQQMQLRWDPVPTSKKLEYRPMGERKVVGGRIAIHARACRDKQPERNWDPRKWDAFVDTLLPHQAKPNVVWIGSKQAAYCTNIGIDRRGATIAEVIAELGTCEFVVGPSSGPLHLANLCGVPVVWWSGNAKDVPRYNKVWNPFRCLNEQASASWDPSVQEVLDAIARLRDRFSG